MSLITFTNKTQYVLNIPRVDKEVDPQSSIQVEWADSDNLRYDEDIQDLISRGKLEMDVPTEEKAERPIKIYANVAAFPDIATVREGTMAVDEANFAGWLYIAVGGNWELV